jgi:membrane protein DedA with SNARE-associated domain
MEEVLHALEALPPLVIYLFIGAGAAIENIVPPVPADTFVLFGAFLAAAGRANPWLVFGATWIANVGSAMAVYWLAGKYGPGFFRTSLGRWLLHPRQLERVAGFYARWGTVAMFFSRFIPGVRAMVPVFAGISRVRPARALPPLACASALWYGLLVIVGTVAGRNWEAILAAFERVNRVLLWIGLVLIAVVIVWWWRTRKHHD